MHFSQLQFGLLKHRCGDADQVEDNSMRSTFFLAKQTEQIADYK